MGSVQQDIPSTSYKIDHKAGSMSLSLHQRRRSHSSSFLVGTSPYTSSPRQRTHTSGSPGNESSRSTLQQRRRSPSNTASSARFVTSTSDFHLPQRLQSPTLTHATVFASSTLVSPKAYSGSASSTSIEDHTSYSSLPLLRRKAAAAALAHASRKGLRRGSMLGKEVAKTAVDDSDSDGEDNMDMESNDKSRSPSSTLEAKGDDIDEDMLIDTADVTVAGVELESKTSRSPSPEVRNTTATRRAVQRRANLLPIDRGVLRVAASLRDETRPAEGEIASEAKLQRRLGPDSDSYMPTTPKLMARRSQSPFGDASGSLPNRSGDADEFCFADTAHFDMSDDSDYDGDDDMVTTKNGHSVPLDAEAASEYFDQGIAIPGADPEAIQRERLWNSFRNTSHPRLSPGAERSGYRGRGTSVAPSGPTAPSIPLSSSLGSALDHAMETDQYTAAGSSPSLWGKSAKRKFADDRYEPYHASVIYKRRAVSPVAIASINNRNQSSVSGSILSPRQVELSQVSPLFIQAACIHPGNSHLPPPTPLSIPSPTISLARMPGFSGASRSFTTASSVNGNRAGLTTSTEPSPSSTRPSTPTNSAPLNPFGTAAAAPSPSLLSSSASKAVTTPGATGGNGVGSGPGYGSGALGLSLGGGSKRYKEEQQEMEEEEGMLGDVSAIKLGEM